LPIPTPQALARRIAFLALIAATLMTTFAVRPSRAQSPTEGTIRLVPAMSDVPGERGPFTVYVVAQDLQHNGSICYDDNRDGTPDRCTPSDGVAAFQFNVQYNPGVLAVGQIQSGPDLGRSGRTFQCLPPNKAPGSVTFGCLSLGSAPPGVGGTLTLASVELIPQGDGLSPLALNADLAGPLGDSVSVAVSGGAARVSGVVTAPTVAPPDGSTTPSDGATTGATSPVSRPPAAAATATARAVLTQTTGTAATSATPASLTPRPATTPRTITPGNPSDSGGFGGATLWSVVVGGSIGAGGLLMLGAMVWRQRQHRSQA
jgi:hypothetical protein